MTTIESFDIEFYKNEFQYIIKMNNDILDVKKTINNKLVILKQTYNNLIKNNYKKIYIFCLDSFYFQYKILAFEMENTANFITMINNRMYGDYYKLYNIILIHCKEKNLELNIETNKEKFPVYKDLEPFYEYTIQEIHNLFLEILKIIGELYNNHFKTETKIDEYKNNINNGISISNLIHTLECENSMLREQLLLYLNYISFFHNIQKDYLMKLLVKVNHFHKEIDEYLSSNDIEISLKQYNLYINKEKNSSKSTSSSRSNSPVNSLRSSSNSLLSSSNPSRVPSPNHSRGSPPIRKNILLQSIERIEKNEKMEKKESITNEKKEIVEDVLPDITESYNLYDKTSNNNNNNNNIYFVNPMRK
jgi:hypothetical protein